MERVFHRAMAAQEGICPTRSASKCGCCVDSWRGRRRATVTLQMAEEVFEHFRDDRTSIEDQRKREQRRDGANCNGENHAFTSSRVPKGIIRPAVPTASRCRQKRSTAVNAHIRRHSKLPQIGSPCPSFWRSYLGVFSIGALTILIDNDSRLCTGGAESRVRNSGRLGSSLRPDL